jgi:excinuclease UvrABC nuclease subunit
MKTDRQKLVKLGFELAGHWEFVGGLRCKLHRHAEARGVLYAFICSQSVMYIGKTRISLRQRMNGYEHPSESQRTNVRNNSYIHEKLEGKQEVEVLVFQPKEQQTYRGYSVNLAAGLEDSVIEQFSPKWNISGKLQEA